MLPEQRGLISSWFSRFRRDKSGRHRSAPRKLLRCGLNTSRQTSIEQLEDRRVLTNTLYVDFGDRMGTGGITMTVAQWFNLGLTLKKGDVSWIHGPEFNFPDNRAVTFIPLRNANGFNALNFNLGTQPVTDPFQFQNGPPIPVSKLVQLETSILQILQREFAPFGILVEAAAAANAGEARYLGTE